MANEKTIEEKKILEYLYFRRKKLHLAKEQLIFKDRVRGKTPGSDTIKIKIAARMEEVEGMTSRIESLGIDDMILLAKKDWVDRKQKKDDEVKHAQH